MRSWRARSTLLALFLGLFPLATLVLLVGAAPAAQANGPTTFTVYSIADSDHGGACNPGVCTLRDALNAANAHAPFADTISFAPGLSGTIVLTASLPAIIDDLTIDGSGHALTVSGASVYSVLSVTVGTQVSLSALTVTNGAGPAACGGTTCGGGAMNNGVLTVTNSTFVNNMARDGAGIWNGGALTVISTTFSGNSALNGGGIENNGTLHVSHSAFNGNTAISAGFGGGIYNAGGRLTVADTTFSGNASTGGSSGDGGGLYNASSPLTVTNSTFYTNTAPDAGGGLFNQSGPLTVADTTFSGNSAGDAGAANGGGLYNASGPLTVTSSAFYTNTAREGGGLWNGGVLTISSSTFSGSSALYGGGLYNQGSALTVSHSAFTANTAFSGGFGGGLYNQGGGLMVADTTFSGDAAQGGSGAAGGALYTTGASVTITHGSFAGNTTSGDGAGLYNTGGALSVYLSTFYSNTATSAGGGLNNDSPLIVTSSTFYSNTAGDGGGLFTDGPVNLTNSTFSSNTAHTAGGGLVNQSGTLTVTNSTFANNTAPVSSGGGMSNTGTLLLQDTLIANNLGGDCAGGALTADSHNLADDFNCASATVTDTAHLNLLPLQNYGGSTATMALGPGSAAIDAGNDATCAPTDQRGVVRPQGAHCDVGAYEREPAQPGPSFIVTRSADTDSGVCVPTHCTLREALNAANAHSGAATITFSIPITNAGCVGPACTITLTSFLPAITGTLTIDGSGQPITVSGANSYTVLTVNSGAHVSLNALTIANAKSSFSDGGGLRNSGALTVTNSTFYSNTAPDGGGLRNSGTLNLINSTFYSNTAADTGGGLVNYGRLTVINSTFYGNTAGGGGGLNNGGTLTVTNSTFYSNTAPVSHGGGIRNAGTLLLRDTFIASNLGGDCASGGTFTADKYNLTTSACANATVTDTAHLKLGPLANNGGNTLTLALLAGSAAIDAGNDAVCPGTDQRGVARPQGKHCDVGAYEFVFNHLYLPLVNK